MSRRLLAAGVVAVLGLLLVPASPASAHASLEDSDPAANSVLVEPPEAVALDFDEEVEPGLSTIRLYGTDGDEIGIGPPVSGVDGTVVQAEVPPLDDGVYAVVWQVASGDGHVVEGAFSFQVGTSVAGDGAALVEQVAAGSSGGAVEFWYAVARFVSLAGVVLCLGALGWATTRLGALLSPRRSLVLRWSAVVVLGVGSAATFVLFGRQTDGATFGDVLGTTTGRMLFGRVVLVLPVAVLVAAWARRSSAVWRAAGAVVGAALAISCSASGHANSLDPRALWVTVDVLHVLAISAWLGGLVVLVLADGALLREPEAVSPVRRFSAVALGAVVVAVATGVAQGLRLAGGLDDVTATRWGQLLLVKVTVVVAMVAVAGVTRWLLHHDGPGSLRRTVLLEAVAAAVVVALAAGMVGEAPRAGSETRPFDEQLVADGVIASVAISPGRVGVNEVHVLVTPAGGALTPIESATARVSLPEASIPDSPIELVGEGANHFSGTVTFPRAGAWTFELVLSTATSSTLMTATVTVP